MCTFWVPEQEGYEYPQMLRSHLGKATGTLDGEPVEGLFMLDYIYSRPDAMWTEMGMLTTVTSSSGAAGRGIAKSWNYTEFFPLNWAAVADYQAAHRGLYGRYPSFARLMKNARIKDQLLVFDEL